MTIISNKDKGLAPLANYLDRQALQKGYLVIFDHSSVKSWKTDREEVDGKDIFMIWV